EKDVRDQIARNNQQIAQIDSQINKVIVENEKRIAEINSQISQAQQTIKYQEVKAPVSGTVFDLKATRGYVPAPNQKEPLLKIVPSDSLTAEVFVTTQDIGFVRPGQKVDIRIDTFPFSEYGDIKGKVVSIGSDALQPDQVYNFFRLPVRIELDNQYLPIEDKKIDLQSGMSVSVNIRVRENRTVLSLFYEQFTNTVETFKDWK
ncbi:MAG: HlyD family efflux transporter periplasmic adaptor subunit, partial [Cyanobacteria bacterium J083]